jgi:hypothetical protein
MKRNQTFYKNDTYFFVTEMLGRIILVLTFFILKINWWLPLVLAPFFWQIWDIIFGQASRIYHPGLKFCADIATYIIGLGYIAISTYLFYRNIHQSYGWIIGLTIGFIVSYLLGLLFPHRWHLEKMDSNL